MLPRALEPSIGEGPTLCSHLQALCCHSEGGLLDL